MAPDDRRAAIVAATREVMAQRGIAGTRVRDVADQLGTSSGLIHHYYESMDELLAEAFAAEARADLASVASSIAAARDPLDQLMAFFDTYDRGLADDDEELGMQIWLDAWAEAARRPALRTISRSLNEEWQGLLAQILRDGVAADQMTCADPDASAWRILSLIDGLVLQRVAHGDLLSREQVDGWARLTAERELELAPGALSPPSQRH